jgi:hypothetical protein
MLDHLRRRVIDLLAPVHVATLSTSGPAGIQAQVLPCESDGIDLYVLVPVTSEHLYNLELGGRAVVTTPGWQLRGDGCILAVQDAPTTLALSHDARSAGCALVKVMPRQLHIGQPNGWGFNETIDIPDESSRNVP